MQKKQSDSYLSNCYKSNCQKNMQNAWTKNAY